VQLLLGQVLLVQELQQGQELQQVLGLLQQVLRPPS
jgi:hypothetical protein